MKVCSYCLAPLTDDDVICFDCLSVVRAEAETQTVNPVTDVVDDLIRTEYTLTQEEIFPDQPVRHSEKDKS